MQLRWPICRLYLQKLALLIQSQTTINRQEKTDLERPDNVVGPLAGLGHEDTSHMVMSMRRGFKVVEFFRWS
jgi:hypothetical protein